MDNIYIFAPAKFASGGSELAHQLCSIINSISDINAKMCYVNASEINIEQSFPIDVEAESVYDIYNTKHVNSFDEIDRCNCLAIIPEALTPCINVLKKTKIALWWMSVDNYIVSTNEQNIDFLSQRVEYHFVQSKYAEEYIKQKFIAPHFLKLSDYINELHGQFIFPAQYRKNQILYNPLKGKDCTDELIKKLPQYTFVPLYGLSTEEMIVIMQSSKLYIDFGNHPGKDRIPREAAANGCCVITNKKGSAKYFEDVPIDEKYKVEDPLRQIDYFKSLVDDIFNNYELHFKMFEDYRIWIKGEKERFISEVKSILECDNKLT